MKNANLTFQQQKCKKMKENSYIFRNKNVRKMKKFSQGQGLTKEPSLVVRKGRNLYFTIL